MTHEELFEKYPKIFQDYEGNPGRVNWGVPNAWLPLVDDLCALIQWHSDHPSSIKNPDYDGTKEYNKEDPTTHPWIAGEKFQVTCCQMKEKFGELRFYTDGNDEYVDGLIDYASKLSRRTCTHCGTTQDDVQMKGGWIEPVCKTCREKHGYTTVKDLRP